MNDDVLKRKYILERSTVSKEFLELGVYEHLKSFENYKEWCRRMNDMFTYEDEARNLL